MAARDGDESSLLARWKTIEDEDDDDRYRRLKESWFLDAFELLKALPPDRHCWCRHRDVAMPLLETFHGFFRISDEKQSIKVLWRRMCGELQICTSCVVQYYQVKDHYRSEYVDAVVKPILAVLLALDKKRVASSMQALLKNPDEKGVACVLFELFMYPEILDDSDLNESLVKFMHYVSDTHELQFATNRKYPGLCALLFHSSQCVRGVAHTLAKTVETFKNAEELELIQPLLEKRMRFLESQSPANAVVGVTFESLWLGLKTILARLEAPAIEEGILDRYPSFFSTLLHYVSESGNPVFWNALCCLKILLRVLGLKLWLKRLFSPSILRNILISQCFHVKDEKIHKEIFQIFQSFLQSLEAMQDGQYEKQRRYLLYFFLQQVPHSSNFSSLARKHASKISFDIVARSYKMEPPLPPFECAHFWGLPLLAAVNENEPIHRESALTLTGILLVADAASLSALCCTRLQQSDSASADNNEDSFWHKLVQQAELESSNWYCVPLIWIQLVESVGPSALRSSLSKAFLWAASRLSIVEMTATNTVDAAADSAAMRWEKPTGCDDGSDGKHCGNTVKASSSVWKLITVFKRFSDSLVIKFRSDGVPVDWKWEPAMAEPLILLLMGSSPDFRKLAKDILQRFSEDTRLDSVIHFLCKDEESRDYIVSGYGHAIKLLSVEPFGYHSSRQHVYFLATRFLSFGSPLFCRKLSAVLWPSIANAITQGQEMAATSASSVPGYETSCSRLFELLPLVFKYTISSAGQKIWNVSSGMDSPIWFQKLIGWNNTPSPSIRRRLIEALVSILEDLARGGVFSQSRDVVTLLQPGSILEDEQRERLVFLFSSNVSDLHQREIIKLELDDTRIKPPPPLPPPPPPPEYVALSSDEEAVPVVRSKEPEEPRSEVISGAPPSPAAPPLPLVRQHKRPPVRKPASPIPVKDSQRNKAAGASQSRRDKDIRSLFKASNKQPLQLQEQSPKPVVRDQPKIVERLKKDNQPIEQDRQQQNLPAEPRKFADDNARLLSELVGDDDLDASKKQRVPISAPPQEKRKLVKIDMPVPDAQLKTSIFSKNRRRQGKPPPPKMDDWLMRILCLDVFSNDHPQDLKQIPMRFESAEQYLETFRPLLVEEFRAQLRRSCEEFNADEQERVGIVNLMSLERIDNLHVAQFKSEPGKASICNENDLLLISKRPFKQCSEGVYLLAKVDRRDKDVFSAKLFFSSNNERLFRAKSALVIRSTWHIARLMNITPQVREFQAVSGLSSSPLLQSILSPAPPDQHSVRSAPMPDKLWQKLKSDYNESQVAAIKVCLGISRKDQHKISLIQGPPGTGKTRTIIAIVSALLHSGQRSDEAVPPASAGSKLSYDAAVASSWQARAYAKELERDQVAEPKSKAKVLVCAQSNAAVDELVGRLREIYSPSGQFYKPKIVRTGNAKLIHPDSLPVYIDTLINEDVENNQEDAAQDLMTKLEQVTEKINETLRRKSEGVRDDSLMVKLAQLEQQKKDLTGDIRKCRKSFEVNKGRRRKMKTQTIRDADIVLTTLGGCGGDVYAACTDSGKDSEIFFDAVVIDEAGQALEPATLIPLQFLGPDRGRCILIGDPKQLPATVLSQAASSVCYDRSMFERFQLNGYPVTMLSMQYRMHPDIRKFPASYFYEDQLVDGASVLGDRRVARFHKDRFFRPYAFLDVVEGQEKCFGPSQSIVNMDEVDVAIKLYERFRTRYPQDIQPGRIGVITPYKQQLKTLQRAFSQRFGEKITTVLEFNTIDGFQGREVDILILSTVRASSESKGIGFVADVRRMNVAITRPRFSLWIIGNSRSLRSNRAWAALLADAAAREVLLPIRKPYSKALNVESIREGIREAGEIRDSSMKRPREHQPGIDRDPKKQKIGAEMASRENSRGIKILDEVPKEINRKSRSAAAPGSSSQIGQGRVDDPRRRDDRRATTVDGGGQALVKQRPEPRPRVAVSETKRQGREEAAAILSGSLLNSRKPDLSTRQGNRGAVPPRKPPDLPTRPK